VPEISAPAKIPRSARNDNGGGILENLRFQKTFKSRVQQATQGFRSGTKYPAPLNLRKSRLNNISILGQNLSKQLFLFLLLMYSSFA
jgi:hypothetical protein